jgi:predicted anti-sigma-YlaC factor YlaD
MTGNGACQGVQYLIVPYLDGELEPEDALRVEEHLERCPECRRNLAEHRSLTRLLGELPESPTRSVALTVFARLEKTRFRRQVARWTSWAAAIAVSVSAAWFCYRTYVIAPEQELIENLGVVEEIASLATVGGADLASDLEIVHVVYELSQETPLEEY